MNNMHRWKFGLLITLVVGSMSLLEGQQLPSWSSYYETGFVWNPALTAKWNAAEFSLTHRSSWTDFEDAPQTSVVAYQHPFVSRNKQRSSIGMYLVKDQVGPYNTIQAAGTYAYGFSPRLLGKYDDVLTFGVKGSIQRHQFDPTTLISFDQSQLLTEIFPDVVGVDAIRPNVGVGVFYNSVSDFYQYQKSHYYIGLAVDQLIKSTLIELRPITGDFTPLGQITSQPHLTFNAGYRYVPYKFSFNSPFKYFMETNVQVLYSLTKSILANASFRFEVINAFWVSAGAGTDGEAFLQTGIALGKRSPIGFLVRDGVLRLGAKMDYHVTPFSQYGGIGYEFYLAYMFELD